MTIATLRIINAYEDPDRLLRKPSKRVRAFDERLHQLLDSMLVTMVHNKGVGLSAPQVGVSQRICLVRRDDGHVFDMINPKIVRMTGSEIDTEFCLSIPNVAMEVERATQIRVKFQDRHGKEHRLRAYDMLARIIQHEVDHLHGILMVNRRKQE